MQQAPCQRRPAKGPWHLRGKVPRGGVWAQPGQCTRLGRFAPHLPPLHKPDLKVEELALDVSQHQAGLAGSHLPQQHQLCCLLLRELGYHPAVRDLGGCGGIQYGWVESRVGLSEVCAVNSCCCFALLRE